MQNNNEINREVLHEINANYIRYLKMEDYIIKKNSRMQWFKEGDTNSKLFCSLIRGRMRKLFIHGISENGEWLQVEENIGKALY